MAIPLEENLKENNYIYKYKDGKIPQKPEEGLGLLRAGVTMLVKNHVGVGNQTWVVCKSNKCS